MHEGHWWRTQQTSASAISLSAFLCAKMHDRHFLIFTSVLLLLSFTLFLMGFFPFKNALPGVSHRRNFSLGGITIQQPKPQYDRLVIVLIDALRSDFVTMDNHMEFVQQQLNATKAQLFTLRAHPPTVTLPRIKAITSGTIPGFVDIVLNFDSSSLQGDNLMTQAHRHGKKIVFYGDDTWLKLFPQHFIRSHGTTSFFVTDYTEVDNNVTRHLDAELSAPDWDMLVLHYLGLDHIGHTVGPRSPLVGPKLQEMDMIIQFIYSRLSSQTRRSLILVCGDHGMSDQGSHGGASDREVFVPAVFLTPGQQNEESVDWSNHRELLQIDLAPTLALLMGLPIPINNLGQAMIGALQGLTGLSEREQLDALHINCQQIFKQLEMNIPSLHKDSSYDLYKRAITLHGLLLNETTTTVEVTSVLRAYELAMDAMATKISASLTNYDLYSMVVAILIQILCLLTLICHARRTQAGGHIQILTSYSATFAVSALVGFCHVTVCTSQSQGSSALCSTGYLDVLKQCCVFLGLQLLTGFLVSNWQSEEKTGQLLRPNSLLRHFLLAGTLFHSTSFASSSCVEEEHQIWYFLVMTVNLVVMVTQVTQSMRPLSGTNDESEFYDVYNQRNEISVTKNGSVVSKHIKEEEQQQTSKASSKDHFHRHSNLHSKVDESACKYPRRSGLPWKQLTAGVTVLLLGRCMRTWNQTGNKWLDTPDVGDWLTRPENKPYLSVLIPISLLSIFLMRRPRTWFDTLLFAAGFICCYKYRISTGTIDAIWNLKKFSNEMSQGLTEARLTYISIGLLVGWALYQFLQRTSSQSNHSMSQQKATLAERLQLAWIIVMTLLLRPHNSVLVAMVILQEKLLWKYLIQHMSLPVEYLTLYCWWMGQAVFFQQGNSNSLSTIDVSAGYVGLSGYQPALVAALLFCSTYAGPIYWFLSLVSYLNTVTYKEGDEEREKQTIQRYEISRRCVRCLMIERAVTISLYCIVVTSQRYHLFVWTVFSPKLLYEGALSLLVFMFSVLMLFTF